MKKSPIKRKKAKRKKKPSLAKRIAALNERAKAVLYGFLGYRCMCCGEWSATCTIHHGIRRSQSWYHLFSPMNWHWICSKCHTIATNQETLYLSMLSNRRQRFVEWILETRCKRETCKRTAANIEKVGQWMLWAEACTTYDELLSMPLWQEYGDAATVLDDDE